MSTCTEINLLNVPEKFILSLLESYFNRFDSHNTITTNTLLVGKGFENYFTGGNEKWISVEFLVPTNSRDSNSVISRPLHVIYLPYLTSEIIISENDLFNLLKTELSASEVPYVKSVCELTFNKVYDKMPLKAKTVKLCLLNNVVNVESDIIDSVLLNYFKCKRFMFKGDVFGVDVNKYLPELQYAKGYHNLSTIYFKVCEIDVSLISNEPFNVTDFINGYIVDDTVALYQLSTQNSFLPSVSYLVSDHESSSMEQLIIKDFLKPLLPSYLEVYADKLMDLFRPFMIYKLEELQLKPLFVLNGPVGCGKSLILKNIAKKLGLQYVRVECSSLTVGPVGFNEAKLRATFARVKKCLPCLLQFSNFEALTEDREGNDGGHIVSCFNKLLIGMKNDLPFVVVGTTSSSDKFSCELLQNILQIINIENPSISDRAGTISWLCQIPQSTVLKVAERTSGFTFSDVTFLVSEAYREKYKQNYGNDNDGKNNELEFEDLVTIIDRMNAQTASAIGAPQVPTVAWSDVGGHNEIKREIVRSLSTADFGTGLRRSGILLWGPPGTGKTLLAKAVATECKSTFLSVKGPELLNMYVGQSEQNVREVFERARDAAPCIIFFDELDSLAPNRGKSDSAGVMDRVVSQLLSEMDGLQKNEGVFVLAATNRPDLIDPALLRPGRLDKMLYVGPCEGTESKLSVLKALTRKFKMNDDVDLHQIAELLPPSLTGADLYSVCYNAWQNAARNIIRQMNLNNSESAGTVIVSADDFDVAVKDLLTSES